MLNLSFEHSDSDRHELVQYIHDKFGIDVGYPRNNDKQIYMQIEEPIVHDFLTDFLNRFSDLILTSSRCVDTGENIEFTCDPSIFQNIKAAVESKQVSKDDYDNFITESIHAVKERIRRRTRNTKVDSIVDKVTGHSRDPVQMRLKDRVMPRRKKPKHSQMHGRTRNNIRKQKRKAALGEAIAFIESNYNKPVIECVSLLDSVQNPGLLKGLCGKLLESKFDPWIDSVRSILDERR